MDGSRQHRIESLIEYNTTEMSPLACESGKATVVSSAVSGQVLILWQPV